MTSSSPPAFSRGDAAFQSLQSIVAEKTRRIVFWVGAGLSRDAGAPSWDSLRQLLTDAGENKAASLELEVGGKLQRDLASIADIEDPWIAFERLQSALGLTTYDSVIKGAFTSSQVATVPETYKRLWRLPTSGIVTLNVDSLASRAHASVFGGKHVSTFTGGNSGEAIAYLHDATDFVAHLHGTLDDRKSWIFTKGELQRQLKNESYRLFVQQALTSCVNVFVGITTDDVAIGGFLDGLERIGVRPQSSFWFTSRNDLGTDKWGERVGVRPIRYRTDTGHTEAVLDFLNELHASRPSPDPVPQPIIPPIPTVRAKLKDEFPSVAELIRMEPEYLRSRLNERAISILQPRTAQAVADYETFCEDYEHAIYMAWYVSLSLDENEFLGYKLQEHVASGSFGRVYRGVDANGRAVAVKLLRHDVRSNPAMLQSFRRGVRSMEILAANRIQDMVGYYAAYEIPSAVAMEWIDGPNLALAKQSGYLEEWTQVLKIASGLANVLRKAHALPERVLHRDLRPANIMLRDLWSDQITYDVIVLDFDLSWHLGSEQQSIQYSSALGYLAPEQRIAGRGTTRSAAVDSYGLGMTFFFLLSGTDPVPDQHMHADYAETVTRFADRFPPGNWKSTSSRFSRLVLDMTRDKQQDRPDMAQILREVSVLTIANGDPKSSSIPTEFFAEEIAARSVFFDNYRYDHDSLSFRASERRGIRTSLTTLPESSTICLSIEWNRTGVENRNTVGKYAQKAVSGISQRLTKTGWNVNVLANSSQGFVVKATVRTSGRIELDDLAISLDKALELIEFD